MGLVKRIRVDHTKCTGCRHCEIGCAMKHMEGAVSPKLSRIKVFIEGDIAFPVLAGPYTDAKCIVRNTVQIGDHEFDLCQLCPASCPQKPIFKEPGTEIPLKCDGCETPPSPICVAWCSTGALQLVEIEE